MAEKDINRMDPTSRGDIEADLMRRWYEANRETFMDRHSFFGYTDRCGVVADGFMIRLMNEAGRIGAMSDTELSHAYNPSGFSVDG